MKEAVSIIDTLKLALEALDMMIVPRSFQAQVRIKEIYDTIEEALAQQCYCGDITRLGVVHRTDSFCDEKPQHVLMAEHWKSMYEQLKASAYTPDEGTLTAEQIKQLKKTAPKRPWVGLTHEDVDKAIEDNQRFGGFRKVGFAYDLEEILKEKNNGE